MPLTEKILGVRRKGWKKGERRKEGRENGGVGGIGKKSNELKMGRRKERRKKIRQ